MPYSLNARLRTEERTETLPGTAVTAGAILLACAITLLYLQIGFARYLVTGFLWTGTTGVVVAEEGYTANVQFTGRDGTIHRFAEDYNLLCGGKHDLCWVRSFTPGEAVPVVYDPGTPSRAYIHDWALLSGAISFFVEAALVLLLLWMILFRLTEKPSGFSIQSGYDSGTS